MEGNKRLAAITLPVMRRLADYGKDLKTIDPFGNSKDHAANIPNHRRLLKFFWKDHNF
ncbi:MAG TPA: hypothetical protein VNQ76_02135 [Planctomicrobium sp.]|nr:hypothetical protein [Planctomicrobium sp.]